MHALPDWDDWEGWAVHADRLTEIGDPRGEILLLDLERVGFELTPDDHEAMQELIAERIQAWIEAYDATLPEAERDALDWFVRLHRRFHLVHALVPSAVHDAMQPSLAQLVAIAGPTREVDSCFRRLLAAMTAWIQRAFDGVEPPDFTLVQAEAADNYRNVERQPGDSEGPWQDLSDAYLLANQWALSHLRADGVRYYFPAVMCFHLRQYADDAFHLDDVWLTESLEYSLLRPSLNLEPYARDRFHLFSPEQRAATAGFCWATHNKALGRWVRAAPAGPDWFDRFLADGDDDSWISRGHVR